MGAPQPPIWIAWPSTWSIFLKIFWMKHKFYWQFTVPQIYLYPEIVSFLVCCFRGGAPSHIPLWSVEGNLANTRGCWRIVVFEPPWGGWLEYVRVRWWRGRHLGGLVERVCRDLHLRNAVARRWVLEDFSQIAQKNTYARGIRYFFRDDPTKKLDGGLRRAKPKYLLVLGWISL